MTTLFNLFCPFVLMSKTLVSSVVFLVSLTLGAWGLLFYVMEGLTGVMGNFVDLFAVSNTLESSLAGTFCLVTIVNLISMVCYSYPVSTTLTFNMSLAISLWLASLIVLSKKPLSGASLLPENSPWYLVPFLGVVEAVSILMRPLTLCFRLLANMSAGHILLSLICKMPYVWLIGVPFGMLELLVCVVQAFVFSTLILVYLEEALSH